MKPILFNTEMVKAILDGRKYVTRRVVKPPVMNTIATPPLQPANKPGFWSFYGEDGRRCAPYQTGDILYVRETWFQFKNGGYAYAADSNEGSEKLRKELGYKWHPSIHMPKKAARLFQRVTDVRVERLFTPFFADGTTIMALKQEGMVLPNECMECIKNYGCPSCIDADDESECGILDEVRGDFSRLWDSTIKKSDLPRYSWSANPWVWVIQFERISKEEAFANA